MSIPHRDFDTVEGMLGYMEIHRETPRALISRRHEAQLIFLASGLKTLFHAYARDDDLSGFVSLHDFSGFENCLKLIREKLEEGAISGGWEQDFNIAFQKSQKS